MTRLNQLDSEQRKVLSTIISEGHRRKVSFPELVAAVSTGLVEASLHNPNYGDGSSIGWRQETASSYPSADRRNVRQSVNRFYDETSQNRGSHPNFASLAQSVQRSAFPGRYAEHGGEAKSLIREFSKTRSGAPAAKPAPAGAKTRTVTTSPAVDNSATRSALLTQYLSTRPSDPSKPSGNLLNLGLSLKSAQDVPAQTKTIRVKQPAKAPPRGGVSASGRPTFKGVTFGHGVVAIGKALQKLGLHVGENPHFGGVAPVHGHYGNFDHYHGGAIDVTGDSKLIGQVAAFLAAHKKELGIPSSGMPNLGGKYGTGVLWQVPRHYDHLHVSASH